MMAVARFYAHHALGFAVVALAVLSALAGLLFLASSVIASWLWPLWLWGAA